MEENNTPAAETAAIQPPTPAAETAPTHVAPTPPQSPPPTAETPAQGVAQRDQLAVYQDESCLGAPEEPDDPAPYFLRPYPRPLSFFD